MSDLATTAHKLQHLHTTTSKDRNDRPLNSGVDDDHYHSQKPLETPLLTSSKHESASRFDTFLEVWWVAEIASGLLSSACTIATAAVLIWMNGKPVQAWKLSLQPNTIVSILSTVAKSSTLLLVTECISQLKWQYYQQQPRRLLTLDVFDRASRGPYGALQLLWTIKAAGLMASLGAVITIAALGIDPFIQQIISFQENEVRLSDSLAQVPVSRGFDTGQVISGPVGGNDVFPLTDSFDASLQGGIFSGLYNSTISPPFSCNAPTCTWPAFSTLGVCSSCKNVSDSTRSNCSKYYQFTYDYKQICNYTTPSNFSLSAGFATTYHSGKVTLYQSVARSPDLPWTRSNESTLLDFAMVKLPRGPIGPLPPPEAQECSFRWCVKTYTGVNVTNGTYFGGTVKESDFRSATFWENSTQQFYEVVPEPTEEVVGSDKWTINKLDWDNTATMMTEIFNSGKDRNRDAYLYRSDNITGIVNNMATSMTAAIRTSHSTTTIVYGKAFQSQTFIRVRWAWFILPCTIVVAANALLAVSIIQTVGRQIPLWKSSSLALLYHGLITEKDDSSRVATVAEMASRAEKQRVKLAGATLQDLKFVEHS